MGKGLFAIAVEELPGLPHLWRDRGMRVLVDHLPRRRVADPMAVIDQSAVLSWRWDLNVHDRTSRNVAVALHRARTRGIRYLFVDLVTVEQRQDRDRLIEDVLGLSALYAKLPVIAAYDERDCADWLRVMRRPWIFHEAHQYRHNRSSVTYVGHVEGQGTADSFGFKHMLDRVWESTLANTILMVLRGWIGMAELSDLAVIMPEHHDVLYAAYASLSRNDFLLSAAILAQATSQDPRLNVNLEPREFEYERFSLREAEHSSYHHKFDILLDDHQVASWYSRLNRDYEWRSQMETLPETPQIFETVLLKPGARSRIVRSSRNLIKRPADVEGAPRVEVVPISDVSVGW